MSPILSDKKYVMHVITKDIIELSFRFLESSLSQGLNILVFIFDKDEFDEIEKEIRLKFWKYIGENKINIQRIPIISSIKHIQNNQFDIEYVTANSEDKIF
jgi:hypothetical protein